MDRLVIIARLRPGVHEEAERLVEAGPPFDAVELGLHRHGVYVSATDVVFLFEAPEVEWLVDGVVNDLVVSAAFGAWRPLIAGPPRIARERYFWERERGRAGAAR